MNVELLGIWAGKTWTALDSLGTLDLKGLKKATKLKEKEIYGALGWLAREGKVEINETEDSIEVTLIG